MPQSGALAGGEGEQGVAHGGVGAGVMASFFGGVCCGEPGVGGLEVVDDVGHGAGGERGAQPVVSQFGEGVDVARFVVGEAFEVGAQGGGDGLLVAGPAVPRKHVETVLSVGGRELQFRLGAWVNNQQSGAAVLSAERAEQLSEVGMRWASPLLVGVPGLVSLGAEAEVRRRRGKACPIRSAGRRYSDRLTAGPR